MIKHIWLLGGDLRSHWLARGLAQEGYFVHTYGLDSLFLEGQENLKVEESLSSCHNADSVIFPLPMCTKEGNILAPYHPTPLPLSQVLREVNPDSFIVGGQVTPLVEVLAKEKGITVQDYFTREELTIANAVPTAEGCIQIAMERLPTTLHGASILVLGYGNVAKATARRFQALGAEVTVAARSSTALAQAQWEGFLPLSLHSLPNTTRGFSCVVNTIPSQVLGEPQLLALPPTCLIIDLASRPGGVDLVAAEKLQRTVVPALSLPGKVAPKTAGDIIRKTLTLFFEEHAEHHGNL